MSRGGAFLAFPCSPCYNVFRKNSVELRCRLKRNGFEIQEKLFRLRDPYDIEASQDLFYRLSGKIVRTITRIAENTVRFLSIFISHLKRCVV